MKNILDKIVFRKSVFILSIIFSLFLTFGYWIDKTGNIHIVFSSFLNFSKWLISSICFGFLIYILLLIIFNLLDKSSKIKKTKLYTFVFEKKPILIPFLIILLCGLPYIIYFYPGTVHWDGMNQLNYFFHLEEWTNHHPVFPTILMGNCVKLGQLILNDNFGVFIYNIIQFLFSSFVFAYCINFMRKLKAPKWLLYFSLLFFSIITLWPINAYTLVKDTYYYLFVLLLFIEIIKYILNIKEKNNFISHIPLICLSILIILFRNNGIFVVLLSLLPLIFINKNIKRVRIHIIILLSLLIFTVLYNTLFLSILNIRQTSSREMLSVPIQQVARFISEYEDEITVEQKEFINYIFPFGIDKIIENYNPEISDPIKFEFKEEATSKDIKNFFALWFNLLKKHPVVYIDSFLENYYGYTYPVKEEYKDGIGWYNIVKNKRVNTGYFKFNMNKKFEKQRINIEDFGLTLRKIPLIGLLYNCGTYTWILLISITYLIEKKKFIQLIPLIPLVITLLFCFLSPVNAYIRYMQPVMVCTPLLVAYIFYNNKKIKS